MEKVEEKVEKIAELAKGKLAELEKADNELLTKSDDDLSHGQRIRKAELQAEAKGAEKTEEKVEEKKEEVEVKEEVKTEKKDKVAERKEEIQSEIDQLVREKKTLEAEVGSVKEIKILVDRINVLESKLTNQEKVEQEKNLPDLLKKAEADRINQYLKEDAEKPREEKREMLKAEIDEWFLEDPEAAGEWVANRTYRRNDEKKADQTKLKSPVEDFKKRQTEALGKLFTKYPKVNVEARGKELASQGKSVKEVQETLFAEVPEYKTMIEIIQSDPTKYEKADGPELVMMELEKRLSGKRVYTEEEVLRIKEEAAEAERKRQAAVDEGNGSTRGGSHVIDKGGNKEYDEGLKLFERAAKKYGKPWGKKEYDEQLSYRKSISGSGDPDRDDKGKIV